jgi:multisubunit Na+/H+ antiporter MnhB subunit
MLKPNRLFNALAVLAAAALFFVLARAVLELPPAPDVLPAAVQANMEGSGTQHPVTAVLLNFRGYDTLLEVAVLWLAFMASACAGLKSPGPAPAPPGRMLTALARHLVPVLIVTAGYLLWRGGFAPGGAFQAGAVLGAAGVLLTLSGHRLPQRWRGAPLRAVLVSGFVVFVAVALLPLLGGEPLLQYPQDHAGALILLIEAAATLGIAATLAALFVGAAQLEDE